MRSVAYSTTTLAAVAGLCIAGIAAPGAALAGCRDVALPGIQAQAPRLTPTDYHPGPDLSPGRDDGHNSTSIVGLWKFEVHLNGAQNGMANDALFDWGLATWHEDATEIQFSAARPPSAGDVCMGAWTQVGRNKFRLHHIALGMTPPTATGTFVGPAIIRAEVTVDPSGNTYSGWYTLSLYPGSPDAGTEFNESGVPLVTFKGTVNAIRVTAD